MYIDGADIDLKSFLSADQITVSDEVYNRIRSARKIVDKAVAGDEPVYGLNTGLGANLGHRISPKDIPSFQRQLIAGRAVACGDYLPAVVGKRLLLARIISAANGYSGISIDTFQHLVDAFNAGIYPAVPEYGSIGAGDLTQNATWAMALLGEGNMFYKGDLTEAKKALNAEGLTPPDLQPKDAMALINHGGLSLSLAAEAIEEAKIALEIQKQVVLLSYVGYQANKDIFSPEVNALRVSPYQAEMAAWFHKELSNTEYDQGRIQDALSFRTVAPILGAMQQALNHAENICLDELNGTSDSPVVMGEQAMCSTPNFHAPALSLAMENLALSMAMMANGSLQRIQKLMNPNLTGLPKYLSPVGGASAGMVPLQKTAAALLADIRRHAMPLAFDAAPVSDAIEDMAAMTPQVAKKLQDQLRPMFLLLSSEALVAAQAIDLREYVSINLPLYKIIRTVVESLQEDRILSKDINALNQLLYDYCKR